MVMDERVMNVTTKDCCSVATEVPSRATRTRKTLSYGFQSSAGALSVVVAVAGELEVLKAAAVWLVYRCTHCIGAGGD